MPAIMPFAPLIPWVSQGPGPIQFGQTEGLTSQNNPVAGAVESIAVNPGNPDHIVAGSVNGGIWLTLNGTSASPSWTAVTDRLPSLAISSVVFDPVNPNTLWAGTGNLSSSGAGASLQPGVVGDGGGNAGIYQSLNGGLNWFPVAATANTFRNFRIRDVVPTGVISNNQETLVVGLLDAGGLWRSTDNGATFTQISGVQGSGLPAGSVTSVALEPGAAAAGPARLYAGVPGSGVYVSADTGATWTLASTGLGPFIASSSRIELVVSPVGPVFPVYAAIISTSGTLSAIARSNNQGTAWTLMDLPGTTETIAGLPQFVGLFSANQGNIEFSMVADPTDANVIYVGGDQQPGVNGGSTTQPAFPNSEQLNTSSGRHFRGDSSQPLNNPPLPLRPSAQWNFIDGTGATGSNGGASGTSVHSGSRDMAFDSNGNILETNEGGVYRLTNPSLPGSRIWSSVNGNLAPTEFNSVAFDAVNRTVFGGAFNVGFAEQTATNSSVWNEQAYWQGRGSVAGVDNSSLPGQSIHYGTLTWLNSTSPTFVNTFHRRTYNSVGGLILDQVVGLQVVGQSGLNLFQFDPPTRADTPYVINTIDPTRLLIGTTRLYESTDKGDTLNNLGFIAGPGNLLGPMAYGGRRFGVDNPDVAYVASGNQLYLRTTASQQGGTFTRTNYFGGTIRAITLDKDNWQRVFVLDSFGNLWRSQNGGVSFDSLLSGNLSTIARANFFAAVDVRALTLFNPTPSPDDESLFVGGVNGVYMLSVPQIFGPATWNRFDSRVPNLPAFPNVVVTSLAYYAASDTLVAGTLGRGAWTVSNLSTFIWDNNIQGVKYEDINGNQIQDPTEPGVLGVTIFIDANNNGQFDPGEENVATDGAGNYNLPNLAPNTAATPYRVREVLPLGYVPSTPLLPDIVVQHSRHVNERADPTNPLNLVVPTDIGNFRQFTISGTVFQDFNGNGVRDPGDTGLPNWQLNLLFYPTGGGVQIVQSVVTVAGGLFQFNNIGPSVNGVRGSYQVTEVVKPGWFETTPDPIPTPPIVPQSGLGIGGLLFGDFQQININGVVFNDLNGNGSRQPGDLGIPNVQVFIDINNVGFYQPGIDPITITDQFGVYGFANQGPGLLPVRVILPASTVQTTPNLNIVSRSGVNIGSPASDIGLFTRFTISGRVFQDINGDGIDNNDPGLSNWTVNLLRNGAPFATTATNTTGAYAFANLGPGTYTVQVVVQAGFVQDTPTPVILGLSGGDTIASVGIFRSFTITGTVFQDVKANGVFDPGEDPPLFNWTIFIDANNNGVLDPGEKNTSSNSNGVYILTDLGPGNYTVREVLKFADWQQTSANPPPIPAKFGETAANVNFGNFHQVNITGTVFSDLNGNGIQDPNDPGVLGATVNMSVQSGGTFNPVASTTSDVNGNYSFSLFQPGTYRVRLQPQPNFQQTSTNPPDIVASSGTFNPGINFGVFISGSISGTVFNDTNGNGVFDAGESGMPNVAMQLTGGASTTTNASGAYTFSGLQSGTYTITETVPPGFVRTNTVAPVQVQSGTNATGRNFGNFQPITVTGTLFQDLNADGTRQPGEPALAGFFVFADANNNGVRDPNESQSSTPSDANGNYTITGVGPGTVRIRIVPQTDWFQTTAAPILATTSGANVSGIVLGAFNSFTISGTAFNDLNNNGTFDPGEPGIANVKIFADADGNGALDANEVSTLTQTDGTYKLTGLTLGTYKIRAVAPQGSQQTSTNPPDQTGAFGGKVSGINFGFFLPISIAGIVFNDLNGNGSPDSGDPGIPGWTVFLDANNNGILDPGELNTQTDNFGSYAFNNVPTGTYVVREIIPAGWLQLSPSPTIQAVSGNTAKVNFANFQAVAISGVVFWDLNRNSVRDPNEPGQSGWTVFLDLNNDGILSPSDPSTQSDANGNYAFSNLGPGTYVVREIAPPGWGMTTLPPVIQGTSGTVVTTANFGNFLANSISGTVFVDTNGDGSPVGKPPLGSVTIYLDDNGNGVFDAGEPNTLSDAGGHYGFANLGPGDYHVREVVPARFSLTSAPAGTLTLSSGNAIADANFGNFQPSSVSGHLFRDFNANGVQDPGEPNLVGAIVELAAGTPDDVVGTVASDGNGNYSFGNLGPATLFVRQRRAAGVLQTTPASGSYTVTSVSGGSIAGLNFGSTIVDFIVTGTDSGGGPNVVVFNASSRTVRFNFFAYDPLFTGGVRVAVGDVSGDGVADIITAPGPGGGPDIHVYDGTTGQIFRSFFAYDPNFTGGSFVASGDVNADGFSDIVVGPDVGGGPNVAVFSGKDNSLLYNFFAYDPRFTGGVRVAAADVTGDGAADIICGAGIGGGPHVTTFNGRNGAAVSSFFAYDPRFTAGIYVAAGDVNSDGRADVVTGPGLGGGADVRVLDGLSGQQLSAFTAYHVTAQQLISLNPTQNNNVWSSGARVAVAQVSGGRLAIVTAPGRGRSAPVAEFDPLSGNQLDAFFAYDPGFSAGVFVGGGHG